MIKINDDIYIDSDGVQYVTKEKMILKNRKTGETYEEFKAVAYHPSLEMALSRLIKEKEMQLVMNNEMTLTEALNGFKTIHEDFKKYLKGETHERV